MKLSVWFFLAVLALTMSLALLGGTDAEAAYPDVSDLQPFTAEAQYMSLAGYLRWQVFMEQGVWISHAEAMEAVMEQQW